MSFVNYYEVLEVERSADAETIRRSVRKQRTDWRRKANHPKAETRALAEKMTQNISEGEATLLDPSRRADFDRQLAAQASDPVRTFSTTDDGGRDWVLIAREYLESGSASQANYAAREATSQHPENADAWYVRGMSSSILANATDAEFELGEAIRLNPKEPAYHCELGDLYSANNVPARAQAAYQRASDLDPSNVFYQVGVASALSAQERATEALPIIKRAHEADPDNELFKFHYAIALLDVTTDQWSTYADGSSAILTEAQLALTRQNLTTVGGLKASDPELREHINEISRQADHAEIVKWHRSDNILAYLGGFFGSLVGMFTAFGIASSGSGGGTFFGVLFLVLLVLIPAIFVKRHYMPGWKWDSKHSPPFVRGTGLQSSAGA